MNVNIDMTNVDIYIFGFVVSMDTFLVVSSIYK